MHDGVELEERERECVCVCVVRRWDGMAPREPLERSGRWEQDDMRRDEKGGKANATGGTRGPAQQDGETLVA